MSKIVKFDENEIFYINRIKKKHHSVICYMSLKKSKRKRTHNENYKRKTVAI